MKIPGLSPEEDFPIIMHMMKRFSDAQYKQFWSLCPSDKTVLDLPTTVCSSSREEVQHELDKFCRNEAGAKDEDWWVFDLMFDIIERNSFSSALVDPDSENSATAKVLFALISRVNHACEPNCSKRTYVDTGESLLNLGGAEKPSINHCIEAIRDIRAGEEISISYLANGAFEHAGKVERRQMLQNAWGFTCACNVCRQ